MAEPSSCRVIFRQQSKTESYCLSTLPMMDIYFDGYFINTRCCCVLFADFLSVTLVEGTVDDWQLLRQTAVKALAIFEIGLVVLGDLE